MAVVEGNDNDRSIVSPVFDAVRSSAFTSARHDRAAHVSRRPSFAHGIEDDSAPRPRGIVKSLCHSVGHESTDISLDQVQLFLGIRRSSEQPERRSTDRQFMADTTIAYEHTRWMAGVRIGQRALREIDASDQASHVGFAVPLSIEGGRQSGGEIGRALGVAGGM